MNFKIGDTVCARHMGKPRKIVEFLPDGFVKCRRVIAEELKGNRKYDITEKFKVSDLIMYEQPRPAIFRI